MKSLRMPEILKVSGIFLFLVLSFPAYGKMSVEDVVRLAQEKELWKEKQWLNLIHYKKSFGKYKSQADGLEFFLAGKEGIKNPQAELIATLESFAKIPSDNFQNHTQCRFPARYLWLESQLHWTKNTFPKITCDAFDAFRKKEDAASASLIFSSYYLNNPSSAYGHTFLRLNKTREGKYAQRSDLLDHGVNYSAAMTTQNPIAYAVMGLSGMFRGVFTNVPYFYKVREYNDFESRDLWEYDLNLTPSEITMLVAHIWELGSTYFDYYYITENCSYHMLTALEAAAPRYELNKKLSYYVIPSDTIKAVYETPGLVSQVNYRPSIRSQFDFRLKHLSRDEKNKIGRVLKTRDFSALKNSSEIQKAKLLDVLMDYVDLKYGKKLLKNDPEWSSFKQKLLLERSQVLVPSPALEIPPPTQEAPHEGHASARTGLMSGYSDQTGPYITLTHRFALHDLLDPKRGYPSYMEIDFVKFDLRYNTRDHHLWPENIDLINIFSLSDFNRFQKNLTWKLRSGAMVFRDEACVNCIGGFLEGGVGLSREVSDFLTATVMLDTEISGSAKFSGSDVRLRLGPMGQLKVSLCPTLQMILRTQYRKGVVPDYVANTESRAQLRWEFVKNIAVEAQVKHFWNPEFWEAGAGLQFYH
ncbi:MAG: DUF4105 domain-containing protein [Deltaproteobacteria bacterium]|nr:MAG: DUF4105 domain-containing protein [Deltaproteobacteria bacterium]